MHSMVSKHVLHKLSFLLNMLTIYFIRTPEDRFINATITALSVPAAKDKQKRGGCKRN